ncbi:MAG: hypothetical protein M3327_10365, partial [Actinomycetota bacterium]|nr:hypothetical protein [Actinomycetota bacterium]
DAGGAAAPVPAAEVARADPAGSDPAEFVAAGPRLPDRVLRRGRGYLSSEAIAAAFPATVRGPVHVAQLAASASGILALGVYRFPSSQPMQGAIELWRGRRLVGAFPVPSGYFGGGIALDRDGALVATFSPDGTLRGIFDWTGRRHDGLAASLAVD